MSRPVVLVVLAALILSGAVLAVSTIGQAVVKQQVGDVSPALSPALQMARPVDGKKADQRLTLPDGLQATLFSTQTPGARDLQFSPDGTLLVSLRAKGQVVALPDRDEDGVADRVVDVLSNIRNPHGLAFRNGKLFVASERELNRYIWDEETLTATFDKKLADLPSGGSGHFTRSLVFDSQGNLYISVGSTCNVCTERDSRNASVLITNEEGENVRTYATGLRNSVFMTLHDSTDEVWATENSRDLLGDDVPPDEINILQENGNYGWPFCYGNQVVDTTFGGKDQAYCNGTLVPLHAIQAHSAALGLTFIDSRQLPDAWQGDLLVAYHGSWNRSVPTGYKVVRMTVDGNRITGESDFMTGFLQGNQTLGRPVDLTFDQNGRLYISDDKAGVIYLVSSTQL